MAIVTTNFANGAALETGYQAFSDALRLDSALEIARAAFDYASFYPATTYSSISSTFIAGTNTNGDQFAGYGTNLLGYPYSLTQLDYQFGASEFDVSNHGLINKTSEAASLTGYINRIEVSSVTYGNATVVGYDDVALGGDGSISSVTWEHGGAVLTGSGLLSGVVSIGVDNLYHAAISGSYDALTFTYASQTIQITGIATNDAYLNASYASADDFFSGLLAGNDQISGTSASEILKGYAGNDTLFGGLGNDTIMGGDGNDTVVVTHDDGDDTLSGGTGFDLLDFSAVNGVVQINQLGGVTTGSAGNDVILDVFEQVQGTNFDDVLSGGHGGDVLDGGGGNDMFFGNNGDDLMRGGPGDDTFFFSNSDGDDRLLGGPGFDVLDYSVLDGVVQVNQLAGTTTGTAGNDTLLDVFEMVIGTAFGDVLSGGHGINSLKGGGGDDQIFANGGNDYISGGDGNDLIVMGPGNDTLDFRNGEDVDTITDFMAGAGSEDTITLKFYSGLGTTTLAGLTGAGRVTQNGAHTQITLNGGDMIILENVSAASLHEDDFVFV